MKQSGYREFKWYGKELCVFRPKKKFLYKSDIEKQIIKMFPITTNSWLFMEVI
jgi:hypothetical protein